MHRLRQLRREAALTQEELAKVAGVSVGTIIRLERAGEGGPEPFPSTIRKLAAALGVGPRVLARCGPGETTRGVADAR
jgi:transcriptional regulator with XRE-family HTH domain